MNNLEKGKTYPGVKKIIEKEKDCLKMPGCPQNRFPRTIPNGMIVQSDLEK